MSRVAVVNADPAAVEVLARVLELDDHDVRRVTGGDDARDAALAAEVVVLDLAAAEPGANLATLERLRADDDPTVAGVRVVVIDQPGATEQLLRTAGIDALLTRPFHGDDLRAAVGVSR